MKTNLVVNVVAILVGICLFTGCTEPVEITINIDEYVELVSHQIDSPGEPPYRYLEVRGEIKNIAGQDIDKIIMIINFKDAQNNSLFAKTYTIYQFIENMTGNFVVEYFSTDEGYAEYDHYEIFITLEDKTYLLYY